MGTDMTDAERKSVAAKLVELERIIAGSPTRMSPMALHTKSWCQDGRAQCLTVRLQN